VTTRSVRHDTFVSERNYTVSADRVFSAWGNAEAKARWFAGPVEEYSLDFRVGGREVVRGSRDNGSILTFDSLYQEIVHGHRIVYTSTLSAGDILLTVSVTTVEFHSVGSGARLVITESAAYLDEHEEPTNRQQGTARWLDGLSAELARGTTLS
jgi:uncharacterized protein YndB with AHSA1/START domain